MAAGDVTLFYAFKINDGKALIDNSADSFRIALIKNSASAPSVSESDPRWGSGGSRNFSSDEVTPGGAYSAGGIALTPAWALVGALAVLSFTPSAPSWAINASNPTNARWGIIYDYTSTNKLCVGFIDLGAAIDMTIAPLQITFNASGFAGF